MLVPKRVKHRREHRGKLRGTAKGGKTVTFGEYGLQALDSHWITNRQIEACRVAMTRHMKRGGKVWIKIFPHKSYTEKVSEFEWVMVKVHQLAGFHQLSVVRYCSKSVELIKQPPMKHYALHQQTSCSYQDHRT